MGVGAMWGATKLHAMSMSSATSVAVFVSPPRRYSIWTVSPGASLRASSISFFPGPDSSSSSDFTPASPVPLNFVMMSPALSPAFSAGPPGVTASSLAPSLSLSGEASVRTTTPMRPRLSLYEKAKPRGARGARGGRGGCCAASHAGPMTATATAAMIHFFNIMNGFLRASQPNIGDAGDVRVDQLLHQRHPILPEFDELVVAQLRLRPAHPGELAVDDGNAVFQLGHQGGDDRVADRGPAVACRPERRQRLEPGDALVQRLQLRLARRALIQVPARPRRAFVGSQREQIVHRAVHHGAAPSVSSMRRSRACARANCDLEKLTVLPISSAISSWVYPSTSCNHTTERDVSLNRSKARSRSIRAGAPATAPGPSFPVAASACPACTPTASSSNSSVTRTWLRRIRIRAFDAAMRLIQPHRCPSPRYCLMLRTTSRNVSCSTSSASSGVRSMRSARLYTGVSNARYSASSASRSPVRARATRMSGTASDNVIG